MARLFGTDGVRGIANTELSCDLAFRLGAGQRLCAGPATCTGQPSLWAATRA